MAQNSGSKVISELAPYLGLGTQLVAMVAVFGIVGWFIDEKADTAPLLLIVFLLLGAIAGMYQFLRQITKLQKKKSG